MTLSWECYNDRNNPVKDRLSHHEESLYHCRINYSIGKLNPDTVVFYRANFKNLHAETHP